jgi:replicative DNA helicase
MAVSAYDAQAAVIGSLLIDESLIGEIMQRLRPEDFGDGGLRSLYSAARDLWLDQKRVDPVTLLDRAGDLYNDLLAKVLQQTPTAANWESYCAIVKNNARLQQLRGVALRILECEKADEARDLLLDAQGLLAQRESIRIYSYKDMLNSQLDRVQDQTPPDFLDWGFAQLNELLTIKQGRFVVIGAESSVGKTALALQLARTVAGKGKKVGFFSLETDHDDAIDRMTANAADLSLGSIKHKRLNREAIGRIIGEFKRNGELPLELIEAAGCTVEEIRAITLMRRYDVIFIDYVQLISTAGDGATEQVRKISIDLHTMATQLGVTTIGLSQVTPPEKDKKGQRRYLRKEDLRESKQLGNDAEAVLLLDLTDLNDYGSPRVLIVDKNKDGAPGKMLLNFEPRHMRFTYQPPFEDSDAAAARERTAIMDRNRTERREKEAAKARTGIDGQQTFEELPDDEEVPF